LYFYAADSMATTICYSEQLGGWQWILVILLVVASALIQAKIK